MRKKLLSLLSLALFVPAILSAGIISKPYSFIAGTVIKSSYVNSDFDTLYSEINGLIDSANIEDGTIVGADIQDGTITNTEIALVNRNFSVNVANYGAVGDGVTDDQPAIQAAINAAELAGGGTVYLQGGKSYSIRFPAGGTEPDASGVMGDALKVDSPNVIIDGQGSELVLSSTNMTSYTTTSYHYAALDLTTNADTCIVQNLRIRYTGTWHVSASASATNAGTYNAPWTVGINVDGNNVIIQNCDIKQVYRGILYGFYHANTDPNNTHADRLQLINNNIHGCGYAAIFGYGDNLQVRGGNYQFNGRQTETVNHVIGEYSSNWVDGYGLAINSPNALVVGANTSYNYRKGIEDKYGTKITISGCVSRYNGYDTTLTDGCADINIQSASAHIVGNSLGGTYLAGLDKAAIIITSASTDNLVFSIVGNVIDGSSVDTGRNYYGILITRTGKTESVLISGNTISHCLLPIYIVPTATGTSNFGVRLLNITGNNFEDNEFTQGDIFLRGIGNASINNNVFGQTTVTAPTTKGMILMSYTHPEMGRLTYSGNIHPDYVQDIYASTHWTAASGLPVMGTFRKGDVVNRTPSDLTDSATNDTMGYVCVADGTLGDTTFTQAGGGALTCTGTSGQFTITLNADLPTIKYVTGQLLTIAGSTLVYEIVWRGDATGATPTTVLTISPALDISPAGAAVNYATPAFRAMRNYSHF